ncbi:MAG: hypothetical protein L0H96_18820 [Humibacillus sp.]|nr:hypothetical protein [Humibacillus sp.]MDN5778951.1 hypothetical protein [Humibacillus sp.]
MRIRLLWGVLAVTTAIGWISWAGGVPVPVVGAYWAAWAWGVVGPGILVHRALRGRPSTMVGDLAMGACVGLVLQLAAWAVMTALGWQQHLLWWPVPLVLAFAAAPRLRRHFSLRPYEQRTATGAAGAGVLAFLVTLREVTSYFPDAALPPRAMTWYQDDLWNLGNVAELMRTVTPQVAQVAGRPFDYHWFSDAHLAAMTLTTTIDPVVVVGRLWAPPLLLVIVGAAMAVGQRVSGSPWVGSGAAVCFAVAPSIQISWFSPVGAMADIIQSPSQIFAVPLLLLALDVIVTIVRGSRRWGSGWGSWVLLAGALVAGAGAKSSVLPVLVGGLALTCLVALLVARRRLRVLLSMAALTVAVVLLTRSRLAGGENGSGLQLLAFITEAPPWRLVHGDRTGTAGAGLLIPGLGPPGAARVLLLVLACYAVSYLWVLVGVSVLRRDDLAGWLLFGTGLAGVVGMFTIHHPAYSELYFLRIAIVAWHLFAFWGYHVTTDAARSRAGGRPVAWSALGGAASGAVALALARWVGGGAPAGLVSPPTPPAWVVTASLEHSLLVPAVVGLAAVGLVAARRRMNPSARALVAVGFASAALAAALIPTAAEVLSLFAVPPAVALGAGVAALGGAALLVALSGRSLATRPARIAFGAVVTVLCLTAVVTQSVVGLATAAGPDTKALVTAQEVDAARWLGRHAGQYDIVATNVHCLPTFTLVNCDARAFWVSGLTGRRVLVEGWGYTDAAQAANGRGGLRYFRQPFDDPALLALNDGAFTDPTPAKLRRLHALGVRWLFADRRAGTVSADLAVMASPTFRSGAVTVYRLMSP